MTTSLTPTTNVTLRGTHPLADLGSTLCTSQGLLESLGKVISPGEWDSAVSETRRSVCNNWYKTANPLGADCLFVTYPESEIVCNVLVAYMNMAYERKIPEYVPGPHPTNGKGTPYWPAYEGNVAVEAVAKTTGMSRKLVQEILYELYWATEDGRITDTRYAHPWTFRLHEEELTNAPPGTDPLKNRSFLDFDLIGLIRWGLILGGVVAGVYVVAQTTSVWRTVTTTFK